MQTICSTRVLALGMLLVPIAGRAQAPAVKGPQPKITEIATIPGISVDCVLRMPNGRVVLYVVRDSILAYNLATKRSTFITRGRAWDLAVSPRGDRIAYTRDSEDDDKSGNTNYIWAIAIDPTTGAPTGPAQRVTTSTSDSPSFSPDGRQIAFVKWRKVPGAKGFPWKSLDLAVVPATGGTERVLAQFEDQFEAIAWSANAKWLYLEQRLGVVPDTATSIVRVPVAGGPSEQVLSYAHPNNTKGLIDERIAFFGVAPHMNTGRIGYLTADGRRGEFKVAPAWGTGLSTFGMIPNTMLNTTSPTVLRILDVATGVSHEIPVEGMKARGVVWSPDKKQLAFVTGEMDQQELVVINVDGSGQRRVPYKGGNTNFNGMPSWSPDGKSLEFISDSGREIRVLNVATGVSRVISTAPVPTRFTNNVRWRPDGKSLLTLSAVVSDSGFRSKYVLLEIGLNGARRVIRDLSTEFSSERQQAFLISDRQAVFEIVDSAGIHKDPWLYLVPLDGGAPRRVTGIVHETGARVGFVVGFSEKWLVALLMDDKTNALLGLEILSTGVDSTRILHFPNGTYTAGVNLVFPDNAHLLRIGRVQGERGVAVYSVPIDGSAARVIGHVPAPFGWNGLGTGLSADGTAFASFSNGTPTTQIYDVDLTPILNLIKKP